MKNVFLLLVLIFVFTPVINAQSKSIIVPQKFYFSMRNNQYKLNLQTKEFFKKEGFQTFYDDELGENFNNCLAYKVSLEKKSKTRKHSIWVLIKDCNGKLILKSKEGKSRLLEVTRAYSEALSKALKSIHGSLKIENTDSTEEKTDIKDNVNKVTYKSVNKTSKFWELLDITNTIKLICYKTSLENVFIAQKGLLKGVLVKVGEVWYFEYKQKSGAVKSEQLVIQFD